MEVSMAPAKGKEDNKTQAPTTKTTTPEPTPTTTVEPDTTPNYDEEYYEYGDYELDFNPDEVTTEPEEITRSPKNINPNRFTENDLMQFELSVLNFFKEINFKLHQILLNPRPTTEPDIMFFNTDYYFDPEAKKEFEAKMNEQFGDEDYYPYEYE